MSVAEDKRFVVEGQTLTELFVFKALVSLSIKKGSNTAGAMARKHTLPISVCLFE